MLKNYQKDFILHLVRSGALKFGQFRLKSGRISPYFVNIALAMKDGECAEKTAKAYVNAIIDKIGLDFDYIHGPAYKGIPLASIIAVKLWEGLGVSVRWGYDRKEVKEYGDVLEKAVVGELRDGDVVLIVDDVITTGATKIENWMKITKIRKVKPKGILVAVDRQELSENDRLLLKKYRLKVFNIVKITDIFDYLTYKEIDGRVHVDEKIRSSFKDYFRRYGATEGLHESDK